MIPRALLEKMAERAGAHVTRVNGGHLTPITHPAGLGVGQAVAGQPGDLSFLDEWLGE